MESWVVAGSHCTVSHRRIYCRGVCSALLADTKCRTEFRKRLALDRWRICREVMAIASTILILARKTKAAQGAAFRYVMVHIFGGL